MTPSELKLLFDKFVRESSEVYNNGVQDGKSKLVRRNYKLEAELDDLKGKLYALGSENEGHETNLMSKIRRIQELEEELAENKKKEDLESERALLTNKVNALILENQKIKLEDRVDKVKKEVEVYKTAFVNCEVSKLDLREQAQVAKDKLRQVTHSLEHAQKANTALQASLAAAKPDAATNATTELAFNSPQNAGVLTSPLVVADPW